MNKRQREVVLDLKEILDRFFENRQALFDGASDALGASLRAGGRILVFGNGGSAAEAQHFAAELVNGLSRRDGPALAALALTVDTSCLTAVGNDRGFPGIFARQIEALGRTGDAALALTTSGESPNIVEGLRAARAKGLVTVALTGEGGGAAARLADILLDVPSCSVPRIQEAHLVLLHLLAERLEAGL